MPVYKLTEQGKAELKKTWTITLIFSYIAIAAIFSYSLLYKGRTGQDIAIYAVVVVALIASFFFGKKKYFAGVDNTQLIVDEETVTLKALSQADVSTAYADVKEIKQGKLGIELVNKSKAKRSLFIMNKFERFDEIQKVIAGKI
jgi:hypothetical protein